MELEHGCRETQASHGFLSAETGESGHLTTVCLDWTARRLGRCREVGGRESPEQTPRDALLLPAPPLPLLGLPCPSPPHLPSLRPGKWKLRALGSSPAPPPAQPHAASSTPAESGPPSRTQWGRGSRNERITEAKLPGGLQGSQSPGGSEPCFSFRLVGRDNRLLSPAK